VLPYKLRNFESWVFDLDNTLYPVTAKLFDQIDKRMCSYIANFLHLSRGEAYKIQKRYFQEHGTSLKGMMVNHKLDPIPYLEYVHEIDLSVIPQDKSMEEALDRLPGKKFVFTNAATDYAERVLKRIGIAHHFEDIFDIAAANFTPKPDPMVYKHFVKRYNIDPKNSVMVEDILRNLQPAADMGMKTVWVQTDRAWAHADAETTKPDFTTKNLTKWLAGVTNILEG